MRNGQKQDQSRLQVFESKVFAKNLGHLKKLEDRGNHIFSLDMSLYIYIVLSKDRPPSIYIYIIGIIIGTDCLMKIKDLLLFQEMWFCKHSHHRCSEKISYY